jgi:hypothetical protein
MRFIIALLSIMFVGCAMQVTAPPPDVREESDAMVVLDTADAGTDASEPDAPAVTPDAPDAGTPDSPDSGPSDAGTDAPIPTPDAGSDAGSDTPDAPPAPDAGVDAPAPALEVAYITSRRCALSTTGHLICWTYGGSMTDFGGDFIAAEGQCGVNASGRVRCVDGGSLTTVGTYNGSIVPGSTVSTGCVLLDSAGLTCWEEQTDGSRITCTNADSTISAASVYGSATEVCTSTGFPGGDLVIGFTATGVYPQVTYVSQSSETLSTDCQLELRSAGTSTLSVNCATEGTERTPNISGSRGGDQARLEMRVHCVMLDGQLLCTTPRSSGIDPTVVGAATSYNIIYSPEAHATGLTISDAPVEICYSSGSDITCVALDDTVPGSRPMSVLYTVEL